MTWQLYQIYVLATCSRIRSSQAREQHHVVYKDLLLEWTDLSDFGMACLALLQKNAYFRLRLISAFNGVTTHSSSTCACLQVQWNAFIPTQDPRPNLVLLRTSLVCSILLLLLLLQSPAWHNRCKRAGSKSFEWHDGPADLRMELQALGGRFSKNEPD